MRSYFSSLILSLAALLLSAGSAPGDDFLTTGASARSTALGGAYLPSSDSALDALAINPAGLALVSAPIVDLCIEGVFARGKFTNSANSGGRLDSNGVIPYGAFGTPLGRGRVSRRLGFGIALLPELLSSAKWRYTDTPGGVGGVSYGPLNDNSEILALRAAAGMGLYVSSKLQIGATIGAVYNANTLQTAYVFQNNPALAGLKTLLDLHTSGVGWNTSVGALSRLTKRLQLGVAYQSRTTVRSKGVATGNAGIQFARIGLGAAAPDFRYNAEVDTVLPRSVVANVVWHVNSRLRLVGQADWINWKDAFASLPVTLSNGSNPDINALLGTRGIQDAIPLLWRNQVVIRAGIERSWLENAVIRAGYAHSNSPVPESTLSPLTAAIDTNTLSAGFGYQHGRTRFGLAYAVEPTTQRTVQQSVVKSGEYSNSRIRVGTQSLVLTTSFRI